MKQFGETHMITSFIITLRETLEAVLIIGIVLTYLSKTQQHEFRRWVYFAILFGILLSILAAYLIELLTNGFEGTLEYLYEGIVMVIGAILITSMIIWMAKQKNVVKELEAKVNQELNEQHKWGLFWLVLISILREGIETVIFLGATTASEEVNSTLGAILGIAVAIILGVLLYSGSVKLNLKKFFTYTNIFLVFVAAGLFSHGIHELQEAGIVPVVFEHIYDVNGILNEKSTLGSFLKGLFGYNGNPSLIEMIVYIIYIIGTFYFLKKYSRGEDKTKKPDYLFIQNQKTSVEAQH
jgi:high-affinity iron transporter